jgi:hypothetical protein
MHNTDQEPYGLHCCPCSLDYTALYDEEKTNERSLAAV